MMLASGSRGGSPHNRRLRTLVARSKWSLFAGKRPVERSEPRLYGGKSLSHDPDRGFPGDSAIVALRQLSSGEMVACWIPQEVASGTESALLIELKIQDHPKSAACSTAMAVLPEH